MKKIEYNGQSITTQEESELTNEQFEQLKKEYYAKPDKKEIINEIANIVSQNGTKNANITNYYFKDLMAKTKVYFSKWSIEDCFNHKPLLDIFYSKTLKNQKVFTSTNLLDNIETAIRLGGKGYASKVANFPIETVDEVFKRYNVNNNYYDMSCGWGARLTSALKNKVNYYGTDPNYLLVERLNEFYNDWCEITHTKPKVEIRCQGSEEHVGHWENIMGLCFTSPPYFYLEDYKIGNQSYKEGTSYESWKDNYLKGTIKNCYSYLIDNGYLAINIKDFDKFPLEQDTQNIAEEIGFVLVEKINLKNIARCKSTGEMGDSDENIMVFMKKGFEHLHIPYQEPEQLTIFDFIEE